MNQRGKFGTTLLMFAAQEGQTPIIDLLLRAGADINGTSEHSSTAISLAALAGHTRVVEHLLDRGALVSDHAAGMPLLGVLRHHGAKHQRTIDLLQARASTSDHP